MLIVTLYTKMSEYTQNTVVINSPMSLSFHILHSHFAVWQSSPRSANITTVAVSARK